MLPSRPIALAAYLLGGVAIAGARSAPATLAGHSGQTFLRVAAAARGAVAARLHEGVGGERGAAAERLALNRRLFGSTAMLALGSAALPTPAGASVHDVATATTVTGSRGTLMFAVASPANDARTFRALLLPNGLRVLLASDPSFERAAASLCVRAGYFADPAGLPGLAHFCEHMLFLGTRKYPGDSAFDQFIAGAAGVNNAYTAAEETCYFFEVDGPALPDALDRFAQFFVRAGPLFDESATARELNAIDSEHSKNLQADSWREMELLKLGSVRAAAGAPHPYAKFGTGNKRTLVDEPAANGLDVRKALLAYHGASYTAERMALVVAGAAPLDELQRLAERCFDAVPATPGAAVDPLAPPVARGLGFGDARGPGDVAGDARGGVAGVAAGPFGALAPFGAPAPARTAPLPAFSMVPVSPSAQSLLLTWAIARPADRTLKPDYLCRALVGGHDAGSLWAALRAAGLADDVGAYAMEEFGNCQLFRVAVDLTDAGVSRWCEAAAMCHAYLGWLRAVVGSDEAARYLAETEALAAVSYQYAEPSEPSQLAESLAPQLFNYAPLDYARGPATLAAGGASGAALSALLAALAPADALVLVAAKAFAAEAKLVEPIYGTRYAELDGGALAREAAAAAAKGAALSAAGGGYGFALPPRNPYVPDAAALALKPPPAAGALRRVFAPSASLSPLGAPAAAAARRAAAVAAGQGKAGGGDGGAEGPWLVADTAGWRVHYSPLSRFSRPFATARLLIASPLVRAGGAHAGVCAKVWAALLNERLERALQPAVAAGYGFDVSAADAGLVLGARGWGYDEARFGALLELLLDEVRRPLFDEPAGGDGARDAAARERASFARVRESFAREAAAFETVPPLQQGGYAIRLLLDQSSKPIEETRAAIGALTPEAVRAFAAAFLTGPLYGEALLCGNANADDARALAARLARALGDGVGGASALPRGEIPRRIVARVPLTRAAATTTATGATAAAPAADLGVVLRTAGRNADEPNGAVQVFWQIGARRARGGSGSRSAAAPPSAPSARLAALEVLAQLLEQPAYATLRTREQLGYAVGAGLSEIDGAIGLFVAVQSAVLPPLAVAGRIDAFVADFANELPRTPPERLRAVVASLARAKRERARRLAQQAGRYWLEVAKGDYQFSRAEEEAAALEAVRLADVVALFRERVLPGGARVRRITSLVEPRAGAAAAAAGAGVSAIDPLALRGSLGVLARPRLDEDVDGGE